MKKLPWKFLWYLLLTALAITTAVLFATGGEVNRVAAVMWPPIATLWMWSCYASKKMADRWKGVAIRATSLCESLAELRGIGAESPCAGQGEGE